jgi:hypothetical protein
MSADFSLRETADQANWPISCALNKQISSTEMLFTIYAGILHGLDPPPLFRQVQQKLSARSYCLTVYRLPAQTKMALAKQPAKNSSCTKDIMEKPVLRIRRIRTFLGLLDPDPDPLVRCTDPDPSIIKQK